MADGKKIISSLEIISHFQDILVLMAPVTISGPDDAGIDGCKLLYYDAEHNGLIFRVPGMIPDKTTAITVQYATINSPYRFESPLVTQKVLDASHSLISLQIPESITQFNRRNHFRIKPSVRHPIRLDIELSENDELTMEVEDISGGGVSFVAPPEMRYMRIGDLFDINLSMPGYQTITGRIMPRNLSAFYDLLRVGAQFSELTEVDRNRILQYIIKRKLALEVKPDPERAVPKPLIWILDDRARKRRYSFLEKTCRIVDISLCRNMDLIWARRPDLLLLNPNCAGSHEILNALQNDIRLKDRPLIITCKKKKPYQVTENVKFLPLPMREQMACELIQCMVANFRRYMEWEKTYNRRPKKADLPS